MGAPHAYLGVGRCVLLRDLGAWRIEAERALPAALLLGLQHLFPQGRVPAIPFRRRVLALTPILCPHGNSLSPPPRLREGIVLLFQRVVLPVRRTAPGLLLVLESGRGQLGEVLLRNQHLSLCHARLCAITPHSRL